MRNLIAVLKSSWQSIDLYICLINNGRTDGVYFYANENRVSVDCWYRQLSEEIQRQELDWFLKGKEYEIK